MNNMVYFNRSLVEFEQSISNIQIGILENLPYNIDIFSDLTNIDDKVNINTQKSYYKLINTIKKYLNQRIEINPIDNNLSKLRNYVDDDNEIQIEWIIRNSYRIGFLIDRDGYISFWKMYKEGSKTNTVSDSIENADFEEKIISILNEVISLT